MALQFRKRLSFASESVEFTQLEMLPATTFIKTKKGKNGEEDAEVKEFKPIKDARVEILTIALQPSDKGQQLVFRYTNAIEFTQDIAFFTLSGDENLPIEKRITWETTTLFTQTKSLKYLPVNSNFPGIETISLARVVEEWLMSPAFVNHLTVLCEMGHYTPDLVKMLILCISYLEVRDDVRVERDGKFSKSMTLDLNLVLARFKEQMAGLIEDTPRLSKFLDVSQFTLAPAQEIKQLEPVVDVKPDESIPETQEQSQVTTLEPLPDTSLPVLEVIDSTNPEVTPEPKEEPKAKSNKKK